MEEATEVDALKLVQIARRHWILMTVGAVLGIALALSVLFRFDPSAPPAERLTQKSYTVYQQDMQLAVIDPGFAMGRAGNDPNRPDTFPKTIQLAETYAYLLVSDAVRAAADKSAGRFSGEILSQRVQDSPIIQVTLKGNDPQQAKDYGVALAAALEKFLAAQQEQQGVPSKDRMTIQVLSAPSAPEPVQSRQWEMAFVAFLAPLVAAYGVAMIRFKTNEAKSAAFFLNLEQAP